jgi:hypothetical protein
VMVILGVEIATKVMDCNEMPNGSWQRVGDGKSLSLSYVFRYFTCDVSRLYVGDDHVWR